MIRHTGASLDEPGRPLGDLFREKKFQMTRADSGDERGHERRILADGHEEASVNLPTSAPRRP